MATKAATKAAAGTAVAKQELPKNAALAKIPQVDANTYLSLADGGEIAEAMAANLGEGAAMREKDLTRVTIPSGGATVWTVPGLMGDEHATTLDGILVYQCVRGLLWASDDPVEGSLPVLVSHDLKTGHRVAEDKDVPKEVLESIAPALIEGTNTYNWELLPQNEWGSGKDGSGKRCKEQRVLFVLRAEDPLPLVVSIQPGSLKNWQEFMMAMTKAGVPYYRAVVSLGLLKETSAGGKPYSQVVPKLIGTISKENGAIIKEKFSGPCAATAKTTFMQ